jgi:crotonobetaine/carnitine-CoA ligase
MTAGIITAMLDAAAARHPQACFLRTDDGELSYDQTHTAAAALATGLARLGVGPGTPVVLSMRNSAEQVLVWFALARLGALHIPINTALLGAPLAHVLHIADPKVVVADRDLLEPLTAVADLSRVTVIVRGAPASMGQLALEDLLGTTSAPAAAHASTELDIATLLFTSGTTGKSKACMLSHRYLARQGQIHAHQLGYTAADVLYCPFPLFHVDAATLTVVAALSVGGTAALGSRFSVSRYWAEVRAFDASVINFMGATLAMLWKQEPAPSDTEHRVRLGWGVPMPDWQAQWERRFGFPLYTLYGLTDGGIPVYDPIDGTQRRGTCGRVIAEFAVRIGASDEIHIRGREPGLTMSGYYGMPEQTAATIDPDGWLHTGDCGRLDADGYLTFLGRLTDSIRRRGENISAHEVEELAQSHPAVLEAAAIGVSSELSEEDVMIHVVLRTGANLAAAELHQFFLANGPRYMAPRYIAFVDSLPKTPTEKVEKFRLRDAGVIADSWDSARAIL